MKNNKYILYAISFLQGLVFYGAFSVVFRESRGLELSHIFLLESIFVLLMLIFEVPWGIIGDRIGYKKTLVISYGLFLLSKIVFYYSYCFLGFLMESVIAALAISGISGCDSALLYSSIDESQSDRVFGIYGAMATAGFLISSLISGILVKISIDLLAFATIIPYTIIFFLSMTLKDYKGKDNIKNKVNKHSILETLKLAVTNKRIVVFVIAIAVLSETTHIICIFFNQPLYIRSGINFKWFGILTAIMQIVSFIVIKAHKIKKKVGEKKLLNIAFVLVILCNFILIFSKISFVTVGLIFIIEGAFAITQPITETIKNESVVTSSRATMLSAYAMIGNVVASIINIIISIASRISLTLALIFCLCINIIALFLIKLYLTGKIQKYNLS